MKVVFVHKSSNEPSKWVAKSKRAFVKKGQNKRRRFLVWDRDPSIYDLKPSGRILLQHTLDSMPMPSAGFVCAFQYYPLLTGDVYMHLDKLITKEQYYKGIEYQA